MRQVLVEVIKWTLVVFVAGFIGYFGRHLSMMIIDKLSKKKKTPEKAGIPEKYDAKIGKNKLKLEKKRLKAKKKRQKNKLESSVKIL